jgi:MFS family permease
LFAAFAFRNYRWLWASVVFSSMGMSMSMLAMGWLVLELTDRPFWVGAVAGMQGVGQVGFGVFGGVLADRFDKRNILLVLRVVTGTVALALGLLVVTNTIVLWHIMVAAFVQGVLMAVRLPATNSIMFQIVGPRRLLNALAAHQMASNLTRVVGSVIAGGVISSFGVGPNYILVAIFAYTAAALLLFVTVVQPQAPSTREPFWDVVRDGVRYVWNNGTVRLLLIMSVFMELFGFSFHIMLPVMARDVLGVGASGLGFLSAAGGLGAVASTLAVASLGDFRNKGGLLLVSALGAGLMLVLFAFSPWYVASLVLVTGVGALLMSYDVSMGTLLQLLSNNEVRGRVMGIYGLTFGFTPLGGFLVGLAGTVVGVPVAMGVGAGVIIAYGLRVLRSVGRIRTIQEETP